ncbi:MAG: helix-turn-helix domain-containing protein [Thiothrix sp.]|uniref:helix-turn-helix domain-containing protein n=1 Tax=Thiothrix sp. TaxID=1032 RepID=UPI00261F3340|nr:helix-turn-helix domain-containing protein [Thiothrix sp.]MDD5394422.1 helix-turn-helix domain-containing protein [Thiothrix sp.]
MSTDDTQKEQPINVNDVIDRLLLVCGAKNDTDYAVLRDLPRSTVGNWRRRQSVPYAECEYVFAEFGVSFDWILTGKGERYQVAPLSSDFFSIEPDTRAELEAIAKANGRSLNAEIAMRLDSSLKPAPYPTGLNPKLRAELETAIKAAGLNPNIMIGKPAESRMIAYLEEKNRQQKEEAKRKPVQNDDKILPPLAISDTKGTKTAKKIRGLIDTEYDELLKKQEQKRLQSETDFERLVRKAVGAVELRKLGLLVDGVDRFKWTPSSMGLPHPLMDSTDVATALEGTILRTICTVLNDVVKDLMVEVVHQELAKAGITLPPDEQPEKEKGITEGEG